MEFANEEKGSGRLGGSELCVVRFFSFDVGVFPSAGSYFHICKSAIGLTALLNSDQFGSFTRAGNYMAATRSGSEPVEWPASSQR